MCEKTDLLFKYFIPSVQNVSKCSQMNPGPGMVATMNEALGKLQVASNSGDLAALQDSLNFELEKNPRWVAETRIA